MSGPTEDPLVGGNEPVALQGGCDNQAVCRVAVHVPQQGRSSRDSAVDRDLYEASVQEVTPPGVDVDLKIEVTFSNPHSDFPYGYGRNGGVALL